MVCGRSETIATWEPTIALTSFSSRTQLDATLFDSEPVETSGDVDDHEVVRLAAQDEALEHVREIPQIAKRPRRPPQIPSARIASCTAVGA